VQAKGVVCVNNGTTIQLQSFETSLNTMPVLKPLSSGYNLSSSYNTESNAVVCEFTRSVTVPAGSENLMHDLKDPVHVLYAAGDYNNGGIGYHFGDANITVSKIDLTPAEEKSVSSGSSHQVNLL
jgi:hypothetical protein